MILVIAEHNNKTLNPATLNVISAAFQLKQDQEIHILVAGESCAEVAEQCAQLEGVAHVIHADAAVYAQFLAEDLSNLVVHLAADYGYILAPATTFSKNCLPRIAAKLDVAQISEVIEIIDPETFVRPLYAGNALATVQLSDPIKVLTIRPSAFLPVATRTQSCAITTCDFVAPSGLSTFLQHENIPSLRPDLAAAKIIISGGRGLESAENFKLLEELADLLGAAVGASRAAVDAGFAPNAYQVGQTGKVVAPALYIAVGISGAIQHVAGMSGSKVIVAINKDAEAPIFQIADYGLVGDLFELLPALLAALKQKGRENNHE